MSVRVGLLLLFVASPAMVVAAPESAGAANEDSSVSAAGITLSSTADGRQASLLQGVSLESAYQPSLFGASTLMDGLHFDLQDRYPLEGGAAIDAGTRPLLALLLGLIVGFGLGHLVARDREGFILFLIVDLIIVAVSSIIPWAIPGVGWFWGLGGLAKLVSNIIQGIDAYSQAGGGRIVEWTRERTVQIAYRGDGRDAPANTFQMAAFAF